jgi:hypothetical protein
MKHESHSCHSRSRSRRAHGHHDRKERVLHTRISEQLAEDIRQFAEDLRVPASNLVRNVLEEVFTMVDSVSDDVGDLFDDVISEAEGVRDRVRGQAESRRRGSVWRSRRRRGRRSALDAEDLETELKQDEAADGARKPAGAHVKSAGDPVADSPNEASPGSDQPRAAELFPDILGWQPLVLNRDFECGRCGRDLEAGESAFLGLGEQGLTQTALCGRCAGHR